MGALDAWLRGFVGEPSFVRAYPYYAYVLGRMDAVEDPSVDVMAVSLRGARFVLHVRSSFFVEGPQYLRGVLLHEVHHVVLGHLSDPTLRGVAHQDLLEVAMELSANEYINEPLPGDPYRWQAYRELGMREGQSTRERYELLAKARREKKLPALRGTFVEPRSRGGFPSPLERGTEPDANATHRVRVLLEEAREVVATPEGRAGLLAGKDPGVWIAALKETDAPPKRPVDWRTALAMFVARMRAPTHTYARPPRRNPSRVGVLPGRRYTLTEGERPRLLVALDTSGSVTDADLAEMARHLRVMAPLAKITVVECDAAVQRVYPFEGALDRVWGRGGTDLRPVFAPAFLREHRPDGVVYFTDGEGPFLPSAPRVPTLWVLTGPRAFACPWGERVWLREAT